MPWGGKTSRHCRWFGGYTFEMQSYEVEIKSLLGSSERADEVRTVMKKTDPACRLVSKNKQLNHYFEGGDIKKLAEVVSVHVDEQANANLKDMMVRGAGHSVRSREKDGEVFLVVKASVDDTTSENGIARLEFEERFELSLEMLDELVKISGYRYQAKWSREREEYVCRGTNVTLDKNAGYGWLAEFERIVDSTEKLDGARTEIRALMSELGAEELPQDRLERMFSYYNAHWPEYYGTDKIFVVE